MAIFLVGELRSVGERAKAKHDNNLVLACSQAISMAFKAIDDADKASVRARENGVVTRALRGVGLQVSPPFVTTPEELKGMADGMAAGIREMEAVVS